MLLKLLFILTPFLVVMAVKPWRAWYFKRMEDPATALLLGLTNFMIGFLGGRLFDYLFG